MGQHVGAGVPVGLFEFGVFKGVQVCIRHGVFLLVAFGAKKNPAPDDVRGGTDIVSRFHPACLSLGTGRFVSAVTGGARPSLLPRGVRGAARGGCLIRSWGQERLQPMTLPLWAPGPERFPSLPVSNGGIICLLARNVKALPGWVRQDSLLLQRCEKISLPHRGEEPRPHRTGNRTAMGQAPHAGGLPV